MCKTGKMPCFRERLNQLLTDSGKTIVGFAKFLGTTRQSLGYYLNGERVPDALMVKQICERCNISADWLLGLSDVKKPDADIQAVCEYTGLSEASISKLKNFTGFGHDNVIELLLSTEDGIRLLNNLDNYIYLDAWDGYICNENGETVPLPQGQFIMFHRYNNAALQYGISTNVLMTSFLESIKSDMVKLHGYIYKREKKSQIGTEESSNGKP